VNSTLELLGYLEPGERIALAQQRIRMPFVARKLALSDELRNLLLLPPAARALYTDLFAVVADAVAALYAVPPPGKNLVPFHQVDDQASRSRSPTRRACSASSPRCTWAKRCTAA